MDTRAQDAFQDVGESVRCELGKATPLLERAFASLREMRAVERIWGRDGTLWKRAEGTVAQIEQRLGWLDLPTLMVVEIGRLYALQATLESEGYRHVVLLGMGGSSLAPEVLGQMIDRPSDAPDLVVLDSTDPSQIRRAADRCAPDETIYLVSSKSGSTVETLALYAFFREQCRQALGEANWPRRFVAVTDPGSPLRTIAESEGMRGIYLNAPDVGGRFSALSFFGLVPAALVGIDLDRLLARGQEMARLCRASIGETQNPAAVLGAALGAMAGLSTPPRDKLWLVTSPRVRGFGAWAEQLIAESTGKEGKGIVPVVDVDADKTPPSGPDRLWVYMRLDDDDNEETDRLVQELAAKEEPHVVLRLRDTYDVGREFFRWEFATAVAGCLLGVNPFDQPDVEAAKKRATEALDTYHETNSLPEDPPTLVEDPLALYATKDATTSPSSALREFFGQAREGDYLAVLAYIDRSVAHTRVLREIAARIETQLGIPATVGFGPRYLHSTGQLHKGGPDTALVLEITAQEQEDLAVPDAGYTFGILKRAQALGDQAALVEKGRRVLRVDLGSDVSVGLDALSRAVARALE